LTEVARNLRATRVGKNLVTIGSRRWKPWAGDAPQSFVESVIRAEVAVHILPSDSFIPALWTQLEPKVSLQQLIDLPALLARCLEPRFFVG